MPACRTCRIDKDPEEFPFKYKARGLRQTRCLPCTRDYSRHWYVRNRAKHQTNTASWKLRNPDKRRLNNARYRASKKLCTLRLTPENIRALQEIYQRAWRLTEKTGIPHHVDHLIPLSHPKVCGLHVPWNLQVIPATMNVKKRNSLTLDHVSLGL